MPKKKKNAFNQKDVEALFKKSSEPESDPSEPSEQIEPEIIKDPPPVVPASPEESDMTDKYRRCLAEFDNFRKRTTKEMAVRYDDGVRAACEKLLPITDNFERALATHADKNDNFFKGIEMIARQFENTFNELGVKEIPAEPGTVFDTNLHYAVSHIADEKLGENQISALMQKGYTHKDKVIRHAMVQVAN
ncbi:MAG: nucleotide exchange factor GrpE [Defluviitaleaceae bacterium]|nr:nucleotide exchange factor GrpE [Defluviitaleaceae bacterium]